MLAEVQCSFVCEEVGCTGSIQIEQATAKTKIQKQNFKKETSRFNAVKRLFVQYMHV